MAAGALAFAVAIPLLAVCESPWQVLGLRIAQAAGLAAFFPSATAAVMRLAPTGRAGACLGWYRTLSSGGACGGTGPRLRRGGCGGNGAVPGGFWASVRPRRSQPCWRRARGARFRARRGQGRCPEPKLPGRPAAARRNPRGPKESKGRSALRRALRCAPRAAPAVLAGSFLAALCYGLQANFLGAHLEAAGMASEASLAFRRRGGGRPSWPTRWRGVWGDAGRKGAAALVGLGLLGLGTMGLGASPQCAQALLPSCALVGAGYFATVTSALLVLADRMPRRRAIHGRLAPAKRDRRGNVPGGRRIWRARLLRGRLRAGVCRVGCARVRVRRSRLAGLRLAAAHARALGAEYLLRHVHAGTQGQAHRRARVRVVRHAVGAALVDAGHVQAGDGVVARRPWRAGGCPPSRRRSCPRRSARTRRGRTARSSPA